MDTIYVDPVSCDLVLDSFGNIAMASNPYALAQDAASAVKTFSGEVYYDTTQGLPYFSQVLGHLPPLSVIRQQMVDAALTVPGVVSAQVFFSSLSGRTLSGQVQVTDATGTVSAIGF